MYFEKCSCSNDNHRKENHEILKNANLKTTKKRMLLINCFRHSNAPLTADDVYNMLKEKTNINLSTVYRALSALTDSKILSKQAISDGTYVFQLNKDTHQHILTCSNCGKITFVEICPVNDSLNEQLNATGYKITGHNLEFIGICPDCIKKIKDK